MDVNDEVDVNLRVTSNLNGKLKVIFNSMYYNLTLSYFEYYFLYKVSPKLCIEYNKENKSEIIETPKHKKRTTQSPNAMR